MTNIIAHSSQLAAQLSRRQSSFGLVWFALAVTDPIELERKIIHMCPVSCIELVNYLREFHFFFGKIVLFDVGKLKQIEAWLIAVHETELS